MKRFWFSFSLAMASSVLIGVLFYVALKQHYPEWRQLNLINTSLSGVLAMISAVAAGLFVYSVRNFKQELRRAYRLLCIGIVLFGLAQVQYPVVSYINATFWYIDGFIAAPYLVAVLFMFLGIRAFAHILDIRSRWASLWWVVGVSLIVAPLVAILPHNHSDFSTSQIASINALTAVDGVFLLFAAATVYRIKRSIGSLYVNAMTWLFAALGVNVIAGLHYIAVNLTMARNSNWYYYDSMSVIPFLAGALLLVRAGYAMVLVNREAALVVEEVPVATGAPGATPTAQPTERQAELPIVNIITYMAALASKPQEIDPTLDVLREVTARITPGEPLSAVDEQRLIGVYQKLEQYLATREPLRTFTILGLRHMVTQEFKLEASAAVRLWQDLPPVA